MDLKQKLNAYVLLINLDNNSFEILHKNKDIFNNIKTYDNLLEFVCNNYILNKDKDLFLSKYNRDNLIHIIDESKIFNDAYSVKCNDELKYFSIHITKDVNDNLKNCIISVEEITYKSYLNFTQDEMFKVVALSKLNNNHAIAVLDYNQNVKLLKSKYEFLNIKFKEIYYYSDLIDNFLKVANCTKDVLNNLDFNIVIDNIKNNQGYSYTIFCKDNTYIKISFDSCNYTNYIVCYINDVTSNEIQEKNEYEKTLEEKEILNALSFEYSNVFVVDYETGNTSYYNLNSNSVIFDKIISSKHFSEVINPYISTHVHADDIEKIFRFFNFLNLKKEIKNHQNHLLIQFKRINKNIIDHAVFSIHKLSDVIIIAVRSINEDAENDIRQKELLTQILKEERQFDALTSLYNKDEFARLCEERISKPSHNPLYLATFDIDRFSVFNDLFGISQGDEVLISVGDVLTDRMHEYNVTFGRLSNDIFALLFDEPLDVIEEYLTSLQAEVKTFTSYFDINLSIGMYKIIDTSLSIETMIDYCNQARKTIKKKYIKTYAIYDKTMSQSRIAEQKVINRMNQALENKEFELYLQPKFDINSNKLIGAEALVRWIKGGEIIPPNEFIPIFEQNGFITKMDLYIWEETLKYLKYRKDNNLELFPISVNASRLFLSIPNCTDILISLVDRYQIEHKYFELEITESLFCDTNLIRDKVVELRENGFRILMDDFGSGYSSLNLLKDVDFDVLKIDLKFFASTSSKSLKIVESVINLAHELNIPAVAEGVETKEYVDLLKKYKCEYAQGYYYNKPMDLKTFIENYDKN